MRELTTVSDEIGHLRQGSRLAQKSRRQSSHAGRHLANRIVPNVMTMALQQFQLCAAKIAFAQMRFNQQSLDHSHLATPESQERFG